jgi:hypothetical protein
LNLKHFLEYSCSICKATVWKRTYLKTSYFSHHNPSIWLFKHCYHFHLRFFPCNNFIFRISVVSVYKLTFILGIYEVTNLASSVDPMQRLACKLVSNSDASVSCSSTTSKLTMLMMRLCNYLQLPDDCWISLRLSDNFFCLILRELAAAHLVYNQSACFLFVSL